MDYKIETWRIKHPWDLRKGHVFKHVATSACGEYVLAELSDSPTLTSDITDPLDCAFDRLEEKLKEGKK